LPLGASGIGVSIEVSNIRETIRYYWQKVGVKSRLGTLDSRAPEWTGGQGGLGTGVRRRGVVEWERRSPDGPTAVGLGT